MPHFASSAAPRRWLLLGVALLGACAGDRPEQAAPDFVEGSINPVAFEGAWRCDPGIAPDIAFSDDGTTREFAAWLDDRLFTSGSWSWDGTTLRVETTAGTWAFTEITLGDGTMVLGAGDARWACRYRTDGT
ncbi:MAG TPA: hypothetical protein PKE51_05915 [Gemmatimonadaceae bacterium]|nr:hypothetical protein [Gemmatimonadaceae bacterium]